MKLTRYKHVRKVLSFYKNHFSIVPPFLALIDGTFCKSALKFKVNIADQLPKYLGSEVKICTTKCVMHECEVLGSLLFGPLQVLKQYDVVRCGHGNPVSATKCLYSLAKKRKQTKYFVATQDPELSDKVRKRPGIPLLYISHLAINLEDASESSQSQAGQTEAEQLKPTSDEFQTLKLMKKSVFGEEEVRKKKKKKKGGPNPLSCKKKKSKTITDNVTKNKRKRNQKGKPVHIPAHLKQELSTKAVS